MASVQQSGFLGLEGSGQYEVKRTISAVLALGVLSVWLSQMY